jgi:hypothetical protein
MEADITAAAARIHQGLEEILTLAVHTVDLPRHIAVLEAIGGQGEDSIVAHLASVLDTIVTSLHDHDDDLVEQAAEWTEQASGHLRDGAGGDSIERAIVLLKQARQ